MRRSVHFRYSSASSSRLRRCCTNNSSPLRLVRCCCSLMPAALFVTTVVFARFNPASGFVSVASAPKISDAADQNNNSNKPSSAVDDSRSRLISSRTTAAVASLLTTDAASAAATLAAGGSEIANAAPISSGGNKPIIDEVPASQAECDAELWRNPPPQLVIAGSAKSGSTALYTKLCTHPNLQCELAVDKEPFTLRDNLSAKSKATTEQLYEAYLGKAFRGRRPGAGNLTVDGSIRYYYNPNSRTLLRRLVPCSKLLFLVRNPIHRARSNYFHNAFTKYSSVEKYIQKDAAIAAACQKTVGQSWEDMAKGLQSRFFKCLEAQVKKMRGRSKPNGFFSMAHPLIAGYWIYYIQELRRRHAVHVLVYDDFESDADTYGAMLDGLTRFLSIPPFPDKSQPPKIDVNKRAARTSKLFASSGRTSLSAGIIHRMKPVLEEQAAALERLIGRKLGWSFDSMGRPRVNTKSDVVLSAKTGRRPPQQPHP